MKKIIAGLFAVALVAGFARADVGAPAPTAKDLEKVVEEVNYVETAKSGIVLSGYVDVGYIYNFSNAAGGTYRFGADDTPNGDFNVNAVKLTLEKPLTAANEFQAGFRVDLMLGEDAAIMGGNAGAGVGGSLNGDSLFVEQAYVTFRTPVGNGIDWKAGKFVTWLGYEVIERPSNLNITYGNLFQNAIPLYHTGLSAEYAFNDIVDAGFAITNGYNNDSTPAIAGDNVNDRDGYGLMAKLNITNPGGNANWYNAIYYGMGNDNTSLDKGGETFIWDTWGNWAPKFANDKLLLGFNAVMGYSDTDIANAVANTQDTSTDYWGAALYAKYQFTDIFSLAGRADYLHGTQEGALFNTWTTSPVGNVAAVGSTDVWSWTLTAGFDLLENFLVRAEYRLDHSEDLDDHVNAEVDEAKHTIALQAVYTF